MDKEVKEKLVRFFASIPHIKLVYFFGSRARGDAGPLSDYDFAVYFDGITENKTFELKLKILGKINTLLKSDDVDLVVLNQLENPVMAYRIIIDGIVLLEKEPFRVKYETMTLSRYFDYSQIMHNHHLSKVKV